MTNTIRNASTFPDLKVEMWPRRFTGITDFGNLLPGLHLVAHFHIDTTGIFMAVNSRNLFSINFMVNDYPTTKPVYTRVSCRDNNTISKCIDW